MAGAVSEFIDFGDEKAYTDALSVQVPQAFRAGKIPGPRLWSLDLQAVSVKAARGILPYFSTAPEAYFRPGGGR